MSQRRGVALVAAAATFLATSVLSTIFQLYSWVLYSFLAIAVVVVVAILARTVRIPVWGQVLAMLGGLLLLVTWTFPSGHELLGFLPTGHTFRHFHSLLTAAGQDIQTLSVPVPERVSLDFLTTVGVGLVAVAVDVLAVGMRHPALAGLPLLALYSVPVAVQNGSVSWLPFVLGAAGYLWLLMTDHIEQVRRWGRRFTGDGRDIDTWEPSPLAAAGRRVGFAALVLAVVVPLAVPGFSSNLLSRIAGYNNGTTTGTGTGTQLGTSINPISTLRGNLTQGQPINLFTVETDDPDPGYLRTAVADQITDNGFQPSPPPHPQPLTAGLDAPTTGVSVSLKYDRYTASVKAQRLNDRYLPLFAGPTQVRAPGGTDWRYEPSTGVVYTDHPATAGANWSVGYDSFRYQPAQLRQAPELQPGDPIVRDNTEVRHIAQISDQVDALTAGKATEYDRVRAILDFFSPKNHFKYSLQTKAGTSGSAIVDFLKGRQGYCEQYASAMAWMTREAGIPARVVVGYTHGTRLGNSATWQVTSHEAHAWVEVWFPAFGWVPFDPTPSTEITGAAVFGWAPNPSTPDTSSGPADNGKDKPGRSAGKSADQGQHGGPGLARSAAAHKTRTTTWQYWVLGVLVLLVLLAVPAGRRGLLRRRRDRTEVRAVTGLTVDPAGGPPDVTVDGGDTARSAAARSAAHAAWDELVDSLVDFRYEVIGSETPRGTAERLIRTPGLTGDAADSVRRLAEAEERARYAPTPADPTGLRAASRDVRTGLSAGVPRHRRIAAVLLPRSVLRRWRGAVADSATGLTGRLGAARDRAYRTVVPRRLFGPRTDRSA
ncbi:transglutaminase TgpA family protein [Actinocatenispora rupis]|uniref:Transglutaminase n=1 Tax=Actinocatenispora rupis TaxID=519421 RepID=A0A8J3NA23_9ACTN|nr:transglutaminaseTgpA domain-containing protein [Actinocatenispora rupis]GID09275.1 transglutaminase [Actinocatenispora rupis]